MFMNSANLFHTVDKLEKSIFESAHICTEKDIYKVQNLIGCGRFSFVYQAKNSTTGKTVAIKALISVDNQMSQDFNRFLKEVKIMNDLNQCSLRSRYVQLIDTVQLQTGVNCLIMERLGATLHSVLFNFGRLPLSMCRSVIRQIVQGLVGLKSMGIVHADLKPDNLMFCTDAGNGNYLVKIIDFGWAFYIKDAWKMYLKKFQAISYRAPEVCFGDRNLDYGLDVWSLGCIMSEMVTGIKLFEVTDEKQLINMIIRVLPIPDFLIYNKIDSDLSKNLPKGWQKFNDYGASLTDEQNREDAEWLTDLVMKMLSIKPDIRITAVEALSHPFLTMRHFIKYPSSVLTKNNVEIMTKCIIDIA